MTAGISFLIALVPAAHIWWTGRRLVSRIDDPAFPELRFAASKRTTTIFLVSVVAAVALSPGIGWLLFIFAAFAVVAANYPARRQILDESWGLWSYVDHTVRFWTAMFGAWIALAFAPAIAQGAGRFGLVIAVALVALAFVWGRANATVFPRILRAKPLERPDLKDRFAAVLASARCRRPRVFEVEAPGGRWCNGLAVPSLRRSAVVMSTDLLGELTSAEAAAIFAHEVAHLEYFEGGALRRREIVAAVLSVALIALMIWLKPGSAALATLAWVWPLVILLALAKTTGEGQAREHESDLRAVELVGDPEVVASALTKIHLALRLPRRWDASREDRFSHPSLARRLRAIRESGTVEATRPAPAAGADVGALLVRDAEGSDRAVMMDEQRLVWLRGIPADCAEDPEAAWRLAPESRAIRYGELSDLRLDVDGAGYRLTAIDGDGQSSTLQLRAGDVGPVKNLLERADLHVGGTSPAQAAERRQRTRRAQRVRLWACVAVLTALLPPTSLPFGVLAGLAVWRPGFGVLAPAGVMGLAAAALHLAVGGPGTVALAAQAIVAAVLMAEALAWRRAKLPDPQGVERMAILALVALGALYGLRGLARLTGPMPMMQLHLWARYQFGLAVVLLGGSAMLLYRERLLNRAAATACVVGVLALLTVGSGWFGRSFGGDPLNAPAPAARPGVLGSELVRRVDLEAPIMDLRISPAGKRVAARVAADDGAGSVLYPPFRVELDGGEFVSVPASDLRFVGDDEIAYVTSADDERLVLGTARLGSTLITEWEISLPDVAGAVLSTDSRRGTWAVYGEMLQERATVRLSGRLRGDDYQLKEWRMEERGDAFVASLHAGREGVALAVLQSIPGAGSTGITAFVQLLGLLDHPITSELWAVGDTARLLATSASWMSCSGPLPDADRFICHSTTSATRTNVWTVDVESGAVSPLAVLGGAFYEVSAGPGDLALARTWNGPPLVMELTSGRSWRIEFPPPFSEETRAGVDGSPLGRLVSGVFGGSGSGTYIHAAALGEGSLAIAGAGEEASRVSVLTVFPPGETSSSR